nr:MarR family transcriptional regulator [Kineosporia rhizophila]
MKALTGRQADRISLSSLMMLSQVQSLGEVRSSGLAELLGVDTSVVSRQLAVLEAAGLTGRRQDPQDGRAWLAHVTEAGAERLAQLRTQRVALVTGALHDWSDGEVRQLCAQLVRLDEAFQHVTNESDPTGGVAHSTSGKVHA